ncbi:uncharacterized protein K444DRAFT_20789 [Hyaloscypha bicolor E]|jgi:hypothetical protein|uniref:Uncharacterized protein n=1 Tax=Hyaloscypha bicolor E TaxID=1095630 RepID=A0A2J6T4V0_9HELO|nr:uncharacterized protein K444DRAFT_20789 [Hyaloscypha bicolor E]PMD58036.1 hypothetical protein K444DRAFT_20789 [Hyaloscypha bicolor E]
MNQVSHSTDLERPPALTLPLPPPKNPSTSKSRGKTSRITYPQSESLPLMRLSLEIYLEVYNAVLGDRRVHISFGFGNFGPERRELEPVPWVMTLGERRGSWWNTNCTWDHSEDNSYRNILMDNLCGATKYWNRSEKHWPPYSMGGMQKLDFAILLTCRKI